MGRRAGRGSARRPAWRRCTSSPATSAVRSAISTGAVHTITRHGRPPQAARDPRPAPQGVRAPVLRPHRAPIDELVLTVLSQNTNDRNRDVAYGRLRDRFSSWDGGARRAGRGGRGGDPARRPRADEGGADQADPRRDRRRRPRVDGGGAARRGARLPLRPARAWAARRPRACCCSPTAVRRCRWTRTCTASARGSGSGRRRRASRGRTTRCCGSSDARGRVRDPRAPDPPRPPHLHGAEPCLPALPAPADVPRGEAAGRLEPPAGLGARADRDRRGLGPDLRDGPGRDPRAARRWPSSRTASSRRR